jgi:pimeloyl-ACP methyl ester carboxylesterase
MRKPVCFEEHLDTGAPQYLLHFPTRGRPDRAEAGAAPVVLFVHGGPGVSESFIGYRLKRQLGDLATLVFWDQRGAGKTLAASGWPVTHPITFEDIQRDMQAVVEHLKGRYNRSRIIVLGHSWGTILGSLHALEHPEDLELLISVGQVVEMRQNDKRAWTVLKDRIVKAGNRKDLAALPAWESLEYPARPGKPPPNLAAFSRLRSKYHMTFKLGPRDLATFVSNPKFAFSDFSFLRQPVQRLQRDLVDFLWRFDLRQAGLDYQMPVAYIMGENDHTTSTALAADYFEQLRAPAKLLQVIPGAGHNPIGEAPEAFAAAFRQALGLIGKS